MFKVFSCNIYCANVRYVVCFNENIRDVACKMFVDWMCWVGRRSFICWFGRSVGLGWTMKNQPLTMSELWLLLASCIQHTLLSLYSSCHLFVKMTPCTYFPLTTVYGRLFGYFECLPMEAGCNLISVFFCLSVCLSFW